MTQKHTSKVGNETDLGGVVFVLQFSRKDFCMRFVMLFGFNLLHCGPWTVNLYIGNSVICRRVCSNSNVVCLFLTQLFDGFASAIKQSCCFCFLETFVCRVLYLERSIIVGVANFCREFLFAFREL